MKFSRWVFKRILVGDGNFKADHVQQKNEAGDIWLSEGSGMIPRREEYLSFLSTAIERLTVSSSFLKITGLSHLKPTHYSYINRIFIRRHRVKIRSGLLQMPYRLQNFATSLG